MTTHNIAGTQVTVKEIRSSNRCACGQEIVFDMNGEEVWACLDTFSDIIKHPPPPAPPSAMMKSMTLKGKDETDLERQLWDWRSANPKAVVTTKHPVEYPTPEMKPVSKGGALQGADLVSMRIDYND
jgi:hypothetical protein